MKTFRIAVFSAGACLFAAPVLAIPVTGSPPPSTYESPSAAMIQHVLEGDAPMPGRKRGGGGRRREGKKKDLSPGLPAMNGATRDDADKEYKKKYGF